MSISDDPKGLIPPLGDVSLGHSGSPVVGHSSFTPHTIKTPNIPIFGGLTNTLEQATVEIDPAVKKLVELKQQEYAHKASRFKVAHYTSLSLGAVLGIITPFLIPNNPIFAQITSIAVVFIISFDQIFKPKDKWSLYSKATDLLQLQLFKKAGTYEQNKDIIDTVINTEMQILTTVPGLNEVLQQVKNNQKVDS